MIREFWKRDAGKVSANAKIYQDIFPISGRDISAFVDVDPMFFQTLPGIKE